MFIIRTAFWLGIIVTLMPTDREAQSRLATAADHTYRQVSTVCERHQTACEQGSAAWGVFKAKAQVAGRMAFDLAMDKLAPQTATQATTPGLAPPTELEPVHTAARAPKLPAPRGPARAQGTLREDDLAPRWQADTGRGRI